MIAASYNNPDKEHTHRRGEQHEHKDDLASVLPLLHRPITCWGQGGGDLAVFFMIKFDICTYCKTYFLEFILGHWNLETVRLYCHPQKDVEIGKQKTLAISL